MSAFERPGAELSEPIEHVPPEIRPSVPWTPYYGIRASRHSRIVMTVILVGPSVLLVALGLFLLVFGASPMFGVLALMFAVPATPFARLFYADLWLPRR